MTPFLGGIFGIAAIAVFISGILISYRIEARSNPARFGRRRLGYTNIFAVALNIGVAGDEETQALRGKLLQRLVVVALLFAGLGVVALAMPFQAG
ncbi:MAG: hypothetical protein KDJ90_01360 [Nitratireductor sp.]|nr:hypothetical protein [Nitratireductor sp.]